MSRHPQRNANTSISAVLPAYNEQSVIEASVRHLAAVLANLVHDFEVIVTNDGSLDETGAILARVQATDPSLNLHVITHERNQGYGAALASGLNAATKQLLFFTDGDKQFDVAELSGFLASIDEQTDLVIGWRQKRADPMMRRINAWGWKMLVNGLFGYTARDIDCAFKLFRRRVWESVPVDSRGATFSAELLIRARRQGFHVKERPVSHFARAGGRATGAKPAVIARAFKELFQLWWCLKRRPAKQEQVAIARV
jgi:glycosyltransferase involved in cell wall biosynthesis